jgi:hypothetical protein
VLTWKPLDLAALRLLPLALQRQVLHKTAEQFGAALDFKHSQQLTELIHRNKPGKCQQLPGELVAVCTLRELQFSRKSSQKKKDSPVDYQYSLPVPGEVVETNTGIADTTEIVNEDPYGKGWLIKVRLFDPAELSDLQAAIVEREIRCSCEGACVDGFGNRNSPGAHGTGAKRGRHSRVRLPDREQPERPLLDRTPFGESNSSPLMLNTWRRVNALI